MIKVQKPKEKYPDRTVLWQHIVESRTNRSSINSQNQQLRRYFTAFFLFSHFGKLLFAYPNGVTEDLRLKYCPASQKIMASGIITIQANQIAPPTMLPIVRYSFTFLCRKTERVNMVFFSFHVLLAKHHLLPNGQAIYDCFYLLLFR